MKNLYFLALVIFSFSLFAQKTVKKDFTLSNGNTKTVQIYIPKRYETDTIHKYPVTIVLNDQYLFNLCKGNAQLFADIDLAPRQIVVGIPTDFAPNKDVSFITKNLTLTANSSAFYDFIKKDLIPYLKANYKTSPFSTIVGQGNAANFLTYFLKENKPIFNAFVCITPKFSNDSNRLLASYNLQRLSKIDNTYFLYVSNSIHGRNDTIRAFKDLQTGLTSFENKNLKLKFNTFKESPNLSSTISESVPRAFNHIFEMYRNISKKEFNEKIKDLDPLEAIKYLEQRYLDLEYLYGTNLNVRIEDIYAIEGIVSDKMDGDYLRVLGEFAMIKYPDSPLGDYYIGKFHETGKNYDKALEYYMFGYGKMDPSDPKADAFYQNIDRVSKLKQEQPKEEPLPLEEPEEEQKKKNDQKEEEEGQKEDN